VTSVQTHAASRTVGGPRALSSQTLIAAGLLATTEVFGPRANGTTTRVAPQ
jgi:hypothetical protein